MQNEKKFGERESRRCHGNARRQRCGGRAIPRMQWPKRARKGIESAQQPFRCRCVTVAEEQLKKSRGKWQQVSAKGAGLGLPEVDLLNDALRDLLCSVVGAPILHEHPLRRRMVVSPPLHLGTSTPQGSREHPNTLLAFWGEKNLQPKQCFRCVPRIHTEACIDGPNFICMR